MKLKHYNLLSFFLWMILPVLAAGQTEVQEFEKIYVQTDKTYYTQDGTVWYKLFLVHATDNTPSALSEVVYVELQDPKGSVIATHEHRVKEGTAQGEFALSKEQPGGLYRLVAYTRWMQQQGEETFFRKELTVQQVITPRLFMKLEFEKRAYGGGDEVEATLQVTDLDNVPADGAIWKGEIRIGGKEAGTVAGETTRGEAKIRFRLPREVTSTDGILQVVVTYKGVTESITRSIPVVLNRINLKFYPEGGELVEGVPGRIAFQGLNEYGKGADIAGEIIDGAGRVVSRFESFHLGMGAFDLSPEPGKTYAARITRPQGNEEPVVLPVARTRGYALKLEQQKEETLHWEIYCPEETAPVQFTAAVHGKICYEETLSLKNGINRIEVNHSDFPAGIAVFTLRDRMGVGLCERLVFVNSYKTLQIRLETDSIHIPGTGGIIEVTTLDEQGEPVQATLGLSVVDEQLMSFANDKQDHLVSYLLLSSDLRGEIEEPAFYFDPEEPKAVQALDYLLLTQGWRRFEWKEQLPGQPEKVRAVSGWVLNKKGQPVQGIEVFLKETTGRKRVAKVVTDREGRFTFRNIDLAVRTSLAVKLPYRISLALSPEKDEALPEVVKNPTSNELTEEIQMIAEEKEAPVALASVSETPEIDLFDSFPDSFSGDLELSDVVVVGYATSRKGSLVGSIGYIREKELYPGLPFSSLLSAAISGFRMVPSAHPARETLQYVLSPVAYRASDGVRVLSNGLPVYRPAGEALSLLSPFSSSLTVYYQNEISPWSRYPQGSLNIVSPEISLRTGWSYKKSRYHLVHLQQRLFYEPEEFLPDWHNKDGLQPTVAWTGITTDREGKARVPFKNNLNVSTFRITAEGLVPASGLVGHAVSKFSTEKPLSVDIKVPLMASVKDEIRVPVLLRNTTPDTLACEVRYGMQSRNTIGERIIWKGESKIVRVEPHSTLTSYLPLLKINESGLYEVVVEVLQGKEQVAGIVRLLPYRQTAFPASAGFAGNSRQETKSIVLPDYLPGTLYAEAVVYTSVLEELLSGVEQIFRIPSGCFEQLSSATMPNIFALQLLESSGKVDEQIHKRALDYLKIGYDKLAAYEVKGGGFEWYGGSPAHQVLSAYGLLEFTEMARVYPEVNREMVERTARYLLNQRNGKGGFHHNRGKYGFSGVPEVIGDAYIVYAMAVSGYSKDIREEYEATLKEARQSKDFYRMALLANAAYGMEDQKTYEELLAAFYQIAEKDPVFKEVNVQGSIIYGYPENAIREAVALWLIALLRNKTLDIGLADICISHISQGRSGGWFGDTQTTSVCLQALACYAGKVQSGNDPAEMEITANGNTYSKQLVRQGKTVIDFSEALAEGTNQITIAFPGTEKTYSYEVNVYWYSKDIPGTSPLELTTRLARPELKVNETTRLDITLRNKKQTGQPMSVAVIGIPGGLSLQPWQLKELQEKGVFDFYEILEENLVIYYRELGPGEVRQIHLDLKAEIPGRYSSVASSAYLYYTDQEKHWIEGLEVNITE
ncbi:MAG: MG2 domain-containing protein [Tannerellaceae bacterium]|nr:MG2 domain-containing protein [Tannerellaceae bacterium]